MAEELTKITHTEVFQVYPPTRHIDPAPFFSRPGWKQTDLFQHKMLAQPLRQRVIEIKDGLRIVLSKGASFWNLVLVFVHILLMAWRIRKYVGKVTKQNAVYKNVHVMLDLADLIKQCHRNPSREPMVNSSMEIAEAIVEHDSYYRGIFYRMVYYIHKKIEAGEWILDIEPFPKDLAHCWDDNKFFGGEKWKMTN